MEFKIEKNIPVARMLSGYKAVYPFPKMEVGDSFLFNEGYNPRHAQGQTKVGQAAYRYAKRVGKKFTVRKIESGVYRVWRVE